MTIKWKDIFTDTGRWVRRTGQLCPHSWLDFVATPRSIRLIQFLRLVPASMAIWRREVGFWWLLPFWDVQLGTCVVFILNIWTREGFVLCHENKRQRQGIYLCKVCRGLSWSSRFLLLSKPRYTIAFKLLIIHRWLRISSPIWGSIKSLRTLS